MSLSTPLLSRWRKLRHVVKVVELRLRFIALIAVTGLVFAYWDTLANQFAKWTRARTEQSTAAATVEYFCPMHPQVVQERPGGCPICGMTLARRAKTDREVAHEGMTERVRLAPFRVAQAGIVAADVAYESLSQTLTTVGEIGLDQRSLTGIPAKVPGTSRVEKLHVNFKGQDVIVGEPLAELFSPELSQAMQELLIASRSTAGNRLELTRLTGEKLKRWGIAQSQIDEVLRKGKADASVTILAPTSGTVVRKNVVEGQQVTEGTTLFELVDLRHVWVQARVYEHQIGFVREGQAVEAEVPAYPGESFSGTVAFVQPEVDPATRTVEVRFDLENPNRRLLPGMFATVTLRTPIAETAPFRTQFSLRRAAAVKWTRTAQTAEEQEKCPVTNLALGSMGQPIALDIEGRVIWTCCASCQPKLKAQPAKYLKRLAGPPEDQVLSVPESAVIDSGRRQLVYVEVEPGLYEGREVTLGPRVGDRFPVLQGLEFGERVAVAGAFLIDAEGRLNPAPRSSTSVVP